MTSFMAGFAGELVKLGEEQHHDAARKYLASMLVGAAAAPVLALVGRGVARASHNRDIARMLKETLDPEQRERLIREIHTGPAFGRHRPDLPHSLRPLVTPGDVAGDVARAALTGSLIQMIRERASRPPTKTDRA